MARAPSLSTIEGIQIDQLAVAEMARLQSNPLGEDNMQEVLGVGGDYDPDDYEVIRKKKTTLVGNLSINMYHTEIVRAEVEAPEEAIHTQGAGLILRPPSALIQVGPIISDPDVSD